MKLSIITHTKHHITNSKVSAYAPYMNEMNLWLKYVDEVEIVAPKTSVESSIYKEYHHNTLRVIEVPNFSLLSMAECFKTILKLPKILYTIYMAMQRADHIHLRCPGNMGLLGSLIQIVFPSKPKTVKYAGNWDPNAKQPWSYKLQKAILANTTLTKNCQVLVYGDWPNQTKNIKSFFTATYLESDIVPIKKRDFSAELKLIFVGTLSKGKHPLKAIQLLQDVIESGREARLNIYGEGEQQQVLEQYIEEHQLSEYIRLQGNQSSEIIKKAYQDAHFLILPSKSEGWPKVVAEAMFWGCIPITTSVSCVPWMLDYGKRGFLIDYNFKVEKVLNTSEESLRLMSELGSKWSRIYTLERFESEIKKLLS